MRNPQRGLLGGLACLPDRRAGAGRLAGARVPLPKVCKRRLQHPRRLTSDAGNGARTRDLSLGKRTQRRMGKWFPRAGSVLVPFVRVLPVERLPRLPYLLHHRVAVPLLHNALHPRIRVVRSDHELVATFEQVAVGGRT